LAQDRSPLRSDSCTCPLDIHRPIAHFVMKRSSGASSAGSSGNPAASVVDESLCQCPICLEVMLDMIFLCPEGHGICAQSCFTTLPGPKKCPQCRKAYGIEPGRGLMVEQIISAARWPCKYGCGFTGTGTQMKAHFEGCPDRPVQCPVCQELVVPSKIVAHYQEKSQSQPPHVLLSIKEDPHSKTWRSDHSAWTIGDHQEYSSISECAHLADVDDFVHVRLWFSEDGLSAMVDAYHVSTARVCKFTCGSKTGRRVVFEVNTRPLCQRKQEQFKDEDTKHGIAFSVGSANTLADGSDEVACSWELFDGTF